MQSLSGAVGEGAPNARHDSALVQALLVLSRRPAKLDPSRAKYLAVIDGDCGDKTKRALRQFQYDQVFVGAGGTTSSHVSGATAGRVVPGDLTWKKLVAAVPAELGDLRVLRGSKTVYVAATPADRTASANRIAGLTFETAFRTRITALVARIFDSFGIVCSVCRDGDRRTFQTQYELLTSGRKVTKAGPGESNHNFGQAVDLGFPGLRWLRADGTVVENEDAWLHQLDPKQVGKGEALIFWNVLRTTGEQMGLHRGPVDDHPHLQAWSDAGIDMATRLAAHLTAVGKMRWTGRNQKYQCDLGFAGTLVEVGSAAQIWSRQSPITAAAIAQLRPKPAGPRPQPLPEVKAEDVTAMRASLRADLEAADSNWQSWRPR